jgi:hypothetical protein
MSEVDINVHEVAAPSNQSRRLGKAFRALASSATALRLLPAQRFEHELALWDLFGFVHGRHFASAGPLETARR